MIDFKGRDAVAEAAYLANMESHSNPPEWGSIPNSVKNNWRRTAEAAMVAYMDTASFNYVVQEAVVDRRIAENTA